MARGTAEMICRFSCICACFTWLILVAAPINAAEAEPLPKEIVEAWKKAKIPTGWLGTAVYDGALHHAYDNALLEPGSFIPAFDIYFPDSPDLSNLPAPQQPFGMKLTFKKASDLAQLKRFKNLTRIGMYNCPLGEEGVKILSEMPQLEELQLSVCKISPEGYKMLAKLKNIKKLGLRGTGITDAEIPLLKAFEKLEHLELGENLTVTDQGAPAIAELKSLKYLDIYLTRVLDKGLKSIAKMTQLRGLYFVNTRATATGLKCLGTLKNLERFHTDAQEVNLETISAVAEMKKLRHLILNIGNPGKNAAGDAEFKKLENLKELRELRIMCWQITDASIPTIRTLENLQSLDIRDTNLKKMSVAQLQKDMPKCKIIGP